MDQGPESEDPEGVVGPASVEAEVAAVEQRRQGAEEEDPARVREAQEAAARSLSGCQS